MADPKRDRNEDQDTKGRGDHCDQSIQGGQNWSQNPGQQSGGKDGKKAEGTATAAGADQNPGNSQGKQENG